MVLKQTRFAPIVYREGGHGRGRGEDHRPSSVQPDRMMYITVRNGGRVGMVAPYAAAGAVLSRSDPPVGPSDGPLGPSEPPLGPPVEPVAGSVAPGVVFCVAGVSGTPVAGALEMPELVAGMALVVSPTVLEPTLVSPSVGRLTSWVWVSGNALTPPAVKRPFRTDPEAAAAPTAFAWSWSMLVAWLWPTVL